MRSCGWTILYILLMVREARSLVERLETIVDKFVESRMVMMATAERVCDQLLAIHEEKGTFDKYPAYRTLESLAIATVPLRIWHKTVKATCEEVMDKSEYKGFAQWYHKHQINYSDLIDIMCTKEVEAHDVWTLSEESHDDKLSTETQL